MKLSTTSLPGLTRIETEPTQDERGSFVRVFCDTALGSLRPGMHFAQMNLSTTLQRGCVRGMHFQHPPAAEAKLIRCIRGCVFDVAVDLRQHSPTFLQWHGIELSEDNQTQIFIPEGFAHGFQAISDDAQLLYMHTASWSRDHEGGLNPTDPQLAIAWPLPITQISQRDHSAPLLDDSFTGLQP